MGIDETPPAPASPPSRPSTQPQSHPDTCPQPDNPAPKFDPSRMIGIIRRKALIKDLAGAYHAECLDYCQELLELQRKWEEDIATMKLLEDSRKDIVRPAKRSKKGR